MNHVPPLDAAAVLWSAPEDERIGRPMLVLLHGYGSDERDLFSLADLLPDEFIVAAVRAPLAPPFPMPGYAWYPIDDLSSRDSSQTTTSAERLLEWLDDTVPAEITLGLLGFSQGAAIALQALRLRPDRFAFAVNLSGYVSPGELPTDADLAEHRPPVFWGRGAVDNVIPQPLIQHTIEWLPPRVDLVGSVYPGLGHSVSQNELDDVTTFLKKQLENIEA